MGLSFSQEQSNPIGYIFEEEFKFKARILQDYTLLNPAIGQNQTRELRVGIDKLTSIQRCVKIYFRQYLRKQDEIRIQEEFRILKMLDHPNIIKVFQLYQDIRNIYIVSEFYNGISLYEQIIEEKTLNQTQAAEIMKQILSAVNYCHQMKIIHRDLKPENIVYEKKGKDSLLKIVDFGMFTHIQQQYHQEVVGTVQQYQQYILKPFYIAPEVIDQRYNHKCDVWSCGIILYSMLVGCPPFRGRDMNEIFYEIQNGFQRNHNDSISKGANIFIDKLLERNPNKRISAQQAIQDTWIKLHSLNQRTSNTLILKDSFKNFQNSQVGKRIQEGVLFYMMNNLTESEEKNLLYKQFKAIDIDNDGHLSKQELQDAYISITKKNKIEIQKEIEQILPCVDKDKSDDVDFTEFFFSAINRQKLLQRKNLEKAFNIFDKDRSGSVSVQEFKRLFGKNMSTDQIQSYLMEVDLNGDGQLSFEEFYQMMRDIIT